MPAKKPVEIVSIDQMPRKERTTKITTTMEWRLIQETLDLPQPIPPNCFLRVFVLPATVAALYPEGQRSCGSYAEGPARVSTEVGDAVQESIQDQFGRG